MTVKYAQVGNNPSPSGGGSAELATTTIPVIISGASAPSAGQVLTATSATTANWQTPSGGGGGGNPLTPQWKAGTPGNPYVQYDTANVAFGGCAIFSLGFYYRGATAQLPAITSGDAGKLCAVEIYSRPADGYVTIYPASGQKIMSAAVNVPFKLTGKPRAFLQGSTENRPAFVLLMANGVDNWELVSYSGTFYRTTDSASDPRLSGAEILFTWGGNASTFGKMLTAWGNATSAELNAGTFDPRTEIVVPFKGMLNWYSNNTTDVTPSASSSTLYVNGVAGPGISKSPTSGPFDSYGFYLDAGAKLSIEAAAAGYHLVTLYFAAL